MSTTKQDNAILSVLVAKDKQTSYQLSKLTGISNPQINFRLTKLIESQVVIETKEEDKTVYSIHSSLKSKEVVKKVSEYIKNISDLVDKEQYATPDGIRTILCFILSKLEIQDSSEYLEQQKIVAEFTKELEEYAKKNDLVITDIKGWTKHKIEWMALNNRLCACIRDGSRHCPCQAGLIEATTGIRGVCTCSVFMGKQWIQKTTKKFKQMMK